MKTVAVSNFKGGVGKTTVSLNLAYTLASRGNRVLLIDLDPQGTLSSWVVDDQDRPIIDLAAAAGVSIANVLVPREVGTEPMSLSDVTFPTRYENIHIVPAYEALVKAKDGILANPQALRFAIDDLEAELGDDCYDYIVLDVSPTLDIKATNAYVAADCLILPVSADGSVRRSLTATLNALKETCQELRLGERPYKVLRSRVKEGTIRDRDCKSYLDQALGSSKMFECCIHDSVKVGEATLPDPNDKAKVPCVLARYLDARSPVGSRVLADFEELADDFVKWTA